MKKIRFTLILSLIFAVVGYIIGVALGYFLGENINQLSEAFSSPFAYALTATGFFLGIIVGLTTKSKKDDYNNKGKTTTGEEFEIAHDSKFMTEDDLKNSKNLIFTTWNNLPSIKETGFVFYNKEEGGSYKICMKKENHALVLGTTGTGKTQILADPTIRILAHSGQKPSLVITDPKKELFEDNANVLKKEGYRIMVLDLDSPFSSSRWNPMEHAFDVYQKAGNLSSEVKKFTNITPEEAGYKKFDKNDINGVEYTNVWYGFEGKAFPNNELMKKELDARKAQLEDEAKSDLRNIAMAISPIDEGSKDPSWSRGCQDFVLGIMQAMLEDSRDPRLGMTKEKFNFFNLTKIANIRDAVMSDRESTLKTLTAYSEGRDPINSNVHSLMNTICGTSSVTQRSFLGQLGTTLGALEDEGILYMTSATDLKFEDLVKEPTAFFLRIPDHKPERYSLAVLCVTQLYKILVDVAVKNINPKTGKSGALPRPVYFILDEFGNMPKFPNFGSMVTIARSRRIFFEIILQSYKQLDIKYGPDEATNIRGNFQTEIFLGSEDPSTIQAFSEACGETTVFHEEESTSKSDKGDAGITRNKSIQRSRRPLVDKSELRTLPQWTVVAKVFGQDIVKAKMTPFYQTKCMEKSPAQRPIALSKKLNAEEIFYDVTKRNSLVLKPKNPFDRF